MEFSEGLAVDVIYVSWDKAIRMCYELAVKILNSNEEFDAIVTISRGGLIPARIVSDVLGIDEFYTIRSKYWGVYGRVYEEPRVSIHEVIDVKDKKVLIIDEVVDTGDTMSKIVDIVYKLGAKEIKVGVLHYKARSKYIPDYYVEKIEKWAWIFYPWSMSETLYGLAVKDSHGDVLDRVRRIIEELGVEVDYLGYENLVRSIEIYRSRYGEPV